MNHKHLIIKRRKIINLSTIKLTVIALAMIAFFGCAAMMGVKAPQRPNRQRQKIL